MLTFYPKDTINRIMALFTPETAANMAQRRWIAERERKAKPAPEPLEPASDYVNQRIARVRKQIERLSDLLDEETDPNKLDRIASAIDRLDEMERKHAGRPLPGSLKPSQPKSTQRRDLPDPTPISPSTPPAAYAPPTDKTV